MERKHPPSALQVGQHLAGDAAVGAIGQGQRTDLAKDVPGLFHARGGAIAESLQARGHGGHRVGMQQIAQVRGAEQLREQGIIQCQRSRFSFRERRVTLIQECRDVAEQQGACERRGSRGADLGDRHRPRLDVPQQ